MKQSSIMKQRKQKQKQKHAVVLSPAAAAVEEKQDHLRSYYSGDQALMASLTLLGSVFTVALTVRVFDGEERLVLAAINVFFGLLFQACIVCHHLYADQ